MKRLVAIIGIAVISLTAFNQVPQKISYQAAVRDAENNPIINKLIGVRIQIIQGSVFNAAIYEEIHAPISNLNGLITIEIGTQEVDLGNFSTIDWSAGPYFLKTEIDPAGGSDYSISSTSQLISVPYAFYANSAGEITGAIPEVDPIFAESVAAAITEADTSEWNSKLSSEVDGDISNELQGLNEVLSINNSANSQIKNLSDPTEAQDAVTRAYIDELELKIEKILWVMDDIENRGVVSDIENNLYKTIKIGNQVWMAENLKSLPEVSQEDSCSKTEKLHYVFGYDGVNVEEAKKNPNFVSYGVLYNWPAAMNNSASSSYNPSGVQGVCPTGWHIPSYSEWTELIDYLGGAGDAAGKLKEDGTTHWSSNDFDATNESGFTALPGGDHVGCGFFDGIGNFGLWCTSTEDPVTTTFAWIIGLGVTYDYVNTFTNDKSLGFSVRCIKD